MKNKWLIFLGLLLLLRFQTAAQENVTIFQINELAKGKLEIRWLNPFKDCIQLSLQRSLDDKQYNTIKTAQTPNLYENRFVDINAPQIPKVFYRISYVLKSGMNAYSLSRSSADTFQALTKLHPAAPSLSNKVFADPKGNIRILIPDYTKHLYRIKFKDDNGSTVFEINPINSYELVLDKTNFIHAGWFLFELYEDNLLKEKNKLLLKRD